jgi:diguanylate cyclase (GGDEF)-like protein
MTEAVQQLARRMRSAFSSMPRRYSYPVVGAALALATPTYILIAHLLMTGVIPPLPSILSDLAPLNDLAPEYAGQVYLGFSTAVLALIGFLIGGKIDRLRSLSITDPLTGLFNRRHLSERLEQEVSRRSRYGTSFSLVAFDLDGLKLINDSFGHKAGDSALLAVAESISKSVRAGDIAARIGGDEFVVILAQAAGTDANVLAQRIATALAKRDGPWNYPLSVSIGVTDVSRAMEARSEDLLVAVDTALYRAKMARGGRAIVAASSYAARKDAVVAFPARSWTAGRA